MVVVVQDPMSRRRRPGRGLLLAVVAALVFATGCGSGQIAQTANQVTATNGAEGSVGTMQVRDAQLVGQRPVTGDTIHHPGADVPLEVTIVNGATAAVPGTHSDRLVSVTSPLFTGARLTGDTRVDDGQVLAAGYEDPVSSRTTPGTHRIGITLVGLREPLRSGLTYPVTFTFEQAGSLTLPLPVENPDFVVPRADGDPRTHR